MNPGYYIEQDLLYQADTYGEEFWPYGPDGPSTLQKEVEEIEVVEEDDCCHIKDFLIKATLMNLREGVKDYARHECQGCRIDYPSQKYHDLCLWTSPQEWIQDFKYHEPALECLNIYNVMEDWDETICDYLKDPKARKIKAVHLLTPEEVEEAYKSWQYFKKSQRELTDQWKKFWAKKLLESYTSEEKTEEQTKSEEKKTKQESEKKCDWPEPSPPPLYEI